MNGRTRFWVLDARLYFLVVILFLTLIFASLNPEGSGDISGIALVPFWFLHTAIPIVLLVSCHVLFARFSGFERLNPWVKVTLSGLAGALLFSPVSLALDISFGNETMMMFGYSPSLMSAWVDEILGAGPPIILVWLAINTPQILQLNFSQVSTESSTSDQASSARKTSATVSGFWHLVPRSLGQEIVYLQAELHYIRVVTNHGEALILYNLRDAIATLPEATGIQTHRSFWISYRYIKRLKRSDDQWVCELRDGQIIPVSRRRVASVRKALEAHSTIEPSAV